MHLGLYGSWGAETGLLSHSRSPNWLRPTSGVLYSLLLLLHSLLAVWRLLREWALCLQLERKLNLALYKGKKVTASGAGDRGAEEGDVQPRAMQRWFSCRGQRAVRQLRGWECCRPGGRKDRVFWRKGPERQKEGYWEGFAAAGVGTQSELSLSWLDAFLPLLSLCMAFPLAGQQRPGPRSISGKAQACLLTQGLLICQTPCIARGDLFCCWLPAEWCRSLCESKHY